MPNSFQGFPTIPRLPWDDLYLIQTFETLDNVSVDESTEGFVSLSNGVLQIRVNSAPAQYGIIQWYKPLTIPAAHWSKQRLFRTSANFVQTGAHAGVYWLASGDPLGSHAFGFKLDDNLLQGFTLGVGGTTLVTLEDFGAAWSAKTRLLEAKYAPGSNVQFFVNGVLKGTITATLPNPAIATDAEYVFTAYVIQLGTVDQLKLGYAMIWQEA